MEMHDKNHDSFEVWPFLIGSSPDIDYCLIVRPSFIDELDIGDLIINISSNKREEKVYLSTIALKNARKITFLFRKRYALESDLDNKKQDNILEDRFGRKLLLTEGIILRNGFSLDKLKLCNCDFRDLSFRFQESGYYQSFYNEGACVKSIDPFFLIPCQNLDDTLPLNMLPEITKESKLIKKLTFKFFPRFFK